MHSHEYRFRLVEGMQAVGGPVAVALLWAAVVWLGAAAGVWPSPRPMLDVDRTVLIRQADASGESSSAEVLLIGDSSCLMNVDATYLTARLGAETLNLGTLSYLDLDSFASLLNRHLKSRSGAPKTVVLLVHPDFVRRYTSARAHVEAWEHYLAGRDHWFDGTSEWGVRRWLGLHIVEGRFLGRLPVPLEGKFGSRYGFTTDLYRYQADHRGSLPDPRTLKEADLAGDRNYWVAPVHRRGAAAFAAAVPEGSRLLTGLTPLPESFPPDDFAAAYHRLLLEWSALFEGSSALFGLPPTLADERFATRAHLRPEAIEDYTEALNRELVAAFSDQDG